MRILVAVVSLLLSGVVSAQHCYPSKVVTGYYKAQVSSYHCYSYKPTYVKPVVMASPAYICEISQDKDCLWWWSLQDAKGVVIAKSSAGYKTKKEAIIAAQSTQKIGNVPIVVDDQPVSSVEEILKNLTPQQKEELIKQLKK